MPPKLSVVVALLAAGVLAATGCQSQPPREAANTFDHRNSGNASSNREVARDASASGNFDYYLLALSWAPEFCATHPDNASSSECAPDRHLGFVVHGMWPQNESGSYPENCGPASPVAQGTVRRMLAVMPSRGLIQHEWRTHGTCTGLAADDYFAQIEKVYNNLQIPADFKALAKPAQLNPSDIEAEFAQANHAPASAVRISCADNELSEVEICMTKDLQYRSCPTNLRDCRASQVLVRPTP